MMTTDIIKELRRASGHRVACIKLSEATIELILRAGMKGVELNSSMQGLVRENLGLDIDKHKAQELSLSFIECYRGSLNEELVFQFAFMCYIRTMER